MAPPVSSSSLESDVVVGRALPHPPPRPAPVLRAVPRPAPKPDREPEPQSATAEVIELDVSPDPELPDSPELPSSVGSALGTAFRRVAANDCVPWEPSSLVPITTNERAAFKMTDEARLRREHLAKYVKAVVAACVMLCVMAAVRRGMSAASPEPRAAVPQAAITAPSDPPAALPPPPPASAPAAAAHTAPAVRPSGKAKRLPR